MNVSLRLIAAAAVGMALSLCTSAGAGQTVVKSAGEKTGSSGPLALTGYNQQPSPGSTKETTSVKTTVSSVSSSWDIEGPVFLRSADPEEPGELAIKNIFGYGHYRRGAADERDEYEYELELEYGLIENHELIFEMPWELGEGRVQGNGDITLGWHWRLWQEDGLLPAFAMRNFVRVPSGVDSSGVDYIWRGLMTWTLVPDSLRLHFNPFLASLNGENTEYNEDGWWGNRARFWGDEGKEDRNFRWGAALGVDYKINENLLWITDYRYENSQTENTRDNHVAELGLDWKLDESNTIGLASEISLDGDHNGPAVTGKISYIHSLNLK